MTDASDQPPGRKSDGPFVADCDAGKHAWCRCERSARYPLCDGAHRALVGPDGTPAITPLKVTFETPRRVAWCACGMTGSAPFCDGSHARR